MLTNVRGYEIYQNYGYLLSSKVAYDNPGITGRDVLLRV